MVPSQTYLARYELQTIGLIAKENQFLKIGSPNVAKCLGYFCKKIVTKNFQKSPNPDTLKKGHFNNGELSISSLTSSARREQYYKIVFYTETDEAINGVTILRCDLGCIRIWEFANT